MMKAESVPRKKISSEEFKSLYEKIQSDNSESEKYMEWTETPVPSLSGTGRYRGMTRTNDGFKLAEMLQANGFSNDLSKLDLSDMDFQNVDFDGINLTHTNLKNCNLSYSNFHRCTITNTCIEDADVTGAQNLKNKNTEDNFDEYESKKTKDTGGTQSTLDSFFQSRTRSLPSGDEPASSSSSQSRPTI